MHCIPFIQLKLPNFCSHFGQFKRPCVLFITCFIQAIGSTNNILLHSTFCAAPSAPTSLAASIEEPNDALRICSAISSIRRGGGAFVVVVSIFVDFISFAVLLTGALLLCHKT